MNQDHARFADWDSAYVLGALPPGDRREYEAHLETCEACSRSVAELAPIPGLLARLPADRAEALLDGAFADRAKAFLIAGDELVKAIGAFGNLSSVFDALPEALANDDLRAGAATLEEVAHDCGAIHDLIPGQIGAMDELFAANGNIGKRLDSLRDNIKIVACIAINARIEASALQSNSQDMLTFTYDVAKLAATAETTIDQYSGEQRKAHTVLQSARDVLTEFDTRHRAQLGSVAREVERNLRSIEGRRTAVLDEASRIGERSR